MAWKIKDIDPEMAGFRSITAVEEATVAIFHSLKRRNYIGAEKINLRNHVHKAALRPFLIAIGNTFADSKLESLNPTIEIREEDGNAKVLLRVLVPDGPQKGNFAYPTPPLNFNFARNDERYHFTEELQWIVNEQNAKSITKHVKDLANRRNQLLYASKDGVPKIRELKDTFLLNFRDIVFQHLCIYLMIDPYRQKQLFVQECLESFIKVLRLLPDDNAQLLN